MEIERYSINLSEQMAVCDANYIRILKLLAGTELSGKKEIVLPSLGVSISNSLQNLVSIEIIEKFKYTSTVKINQKLNQGVSKDIAQNVQYDTPEMLIRMYHDANTAEVISYQGHKYFKASYPLPNKNMYQVDEKEQQNLFLSQWLQLCLKEGLHPVKKLSEEYLTCL
jgi:uncharacterized protein